MFGADGGRFGFCSICADNEGILDWGGFHSSYATEFFKKGCSSA